MTYSALKLLIIGLLLFVGQSGWSQNQHTMDRIDTCYHWMKQDYFFAKIKYAEQNAGEFQFPGTDPVYCWKSPLGAYSAWEDHGEYLVRIKFKPKVEIINSRRTQLQWMKADVYYSNDNIWHEYTIRPSAIESWSVFHPNTTKEMQAELKYYNENLVTPNDVFYPFSQFNLNFLNDRIPKTIELNQLGASRRQSKIYGQNIEEHFMTAYELPWHKFLKRNAEMAFKQLPKLIILEASYGLNLDPKNQGNATASASAYCAGKASCSYQVNPRFLRLSLPESVAKDFEIKWKCVNPGADQAADPWQVHKESAPSDYKFFEMNCI